MTVILTGLPVDGAGRTETCRVELAGLWKPLCCSRVLSQSKASLAVSAEALNEFRVPVVKVFFFSLRGQRLRLSL